MIRLGDTIVNEENVAAIKKRMDHVNVWFDTGMSITAEITIEEAQQALAQAGLLQMPEQPAGIHFTPAELEELDAAFYDGYRYAAKDESGSVFAYTEVPHKGKSSWVNDDDVSRVTRLKAGDYDLLSFDDDHPLDIAATLDTF